MGEINAFLKALATEIYRIWRGYLIVPDQISGIAAAALNDTLSAILGIEVSPRKPVDDDQIRAASLHLMRASEILERMKNELEVRASNLKHVIPKSKRTKNQQSILKFCLRQMNLRCQQ
jgi:hypothetical protein